jgi:hypothetical protein
MRQFSESFGHAFKQYLLMDGQASHRGKNKEERMKKVGTIHGLKLGLMILFAVAAMSSAAFAEDAKPAALIINTDELKKALGLSIYLQAGYTYNSDAGAIGGQEEQNDLRVFDHNANSFTFDLAQIVFQKDPALGGAGYKLKLSAGETAKWIHSRGLSGAPLTSPQTGDGTDSFDLTEAYISYNAEVGKGLRFDVGKMVTFLGAEVIEAIDNPNYSRSFLFNYAIPFTHTGLRASYAFTDTLNAALYFVNGWDDSTDNNKGKSYGVSIGYAPVELFSILVNGMTGPEQDNNDSNQRSILDVVATIKPVKNLSLIVNTDNAREQNIAPAGGAASWSGIAAIVKYDFNDKYSLALRGETFGDNEGVRTGTAQRLKEITVTPEIRLNGGLILRPEYRHDSSNQSSFDNSTKQSQNTLALGVMYRW